ncbi:uncharacterized protein LOC118200955 [Stegodyphus dumicola]|uniref:uncharacterized protein LOC118200955 n=1 Tax=Stegodyphus dumicola TaxID=202533 RepID=UPI0015ABA8CC|nr:uncharacterized protein LOC118200955 [Stegodyphus dumicola]
MQLETGGKLQPAVDSAASSAAKHMNSRKFRLFVTDRNSGLKFLVDIGADVSLLPANSTTKGSCEYKLYAANGTEIPTFGIKVLTLDLGLRRPFQWSFIVAKVSKRMLGADFLNQFHLLIDIKKKQLIDGITQLKVSSDIMSIGVDHVISTLNNSFKFAEFLRQYPNITKPNVLNKQTKHNVKHYICTEGQPVYARARQLDAKKQTGKARIPVYA